MSKLSLTDLEVRNLIDLYKSELRKLLYQVNKTTATIDELENSLKSEISDASLPTLSKQVDVESEYEEQVQDESEEIEPTKKRKRGRPKKSENIETAITAKKRGRGRPKGSTNKKKRKRNVKNGYKLSSWDTMIISELKSSDEPLTSADFMDKGVEMAEKDNLNMNEGDIKGKISRSIHKLANKRKVIRKVPKEGRGNAYELI